MFCGATNFNEYIEGCDTSNVTDMSSMLMDLEGLINIYILGMEY